MMCSHCAKIFSAAAAAANGKPKGVVAGVGTEGTISSFFDPFPSVITHVVIENRTSILVGRDRECSPCGSGMRVGQSVW